MIVRDHRLYLDDRELTLDTAALSVTSTIEAQDNTRLQGSTRVVEAGLGAHAFSIEGFWSSISVSDSLDADAFANLGTGTVLSVLPAGATVGDLAYFLSALETEYAPLSGEVGDSHRFSLAGVSRDRMLRGIILHRGTITVTGSGTGVNLGTSNNKQIYAALHVTAVAGSSPTLVVRIQRDADNTFASPANEITFASQNARGSVFMGPEPGAVAGDTWWRADWTVTGTGGPSFTVLIVMAIVD